MIFNAEIYYPKGYYPSVILASAEQFHNLLRINHST